VTFIGLRNRDQRWIHI